MSEDKVVPFPQRAVNQESDIVIGTKQDDAIGRILSCNCGCNSFCINEFGAVYCWNCKARQVGEAVLVVTGMLKS